MSCPQRVLMVCLGNICRSPLAEVVIRRKAKEMGLDDAFVFASAGTGDWHVGCGADRRAIAVAAEHGLDLRAHRARQVTSENFGEWDWFVAMDEANAAELLRMGVPRARLLRMRQFEPGGGGDVPDPYYGGPRGFEQVYRLLEDNAERIVRFLHEEKGGAS